jgi:hypothetical protein
MVQRRTTNAASAKPNDQIGVGGPSRRAAPNEAALRSAAHLSKQLLADDRREIALDPALRIRHAPALPVLSNAQTWLKATEDTTVC